MSSAIGLTVATEPPDMWQDCYQTGLYPICRSDTEIAAVHWNHRSQLLWVPGAALLPTDILLENGEEAEQNLWKLDRWRETAHGINLEEDQAGDWGQNAVVQQHSHQMSSTSLRSDTVCFSQICSWVISHYYPHRSQGWILILHLESFILLSALNL